MPVIGLDITMKRPLADGQSFGGVGPYEEVRGLIKFAVDPLHPANDRVTDIDLAPRNSNGKVEFSSDFTLLRPADPEAGSRRLFFDVLNRGRRVALGLFNEAPRVYAATAETDLDLPLDPGNGWLMENGWTVLWTGWQADPPPDPALMRLHAPDATDSSGAPLTGMIFSQFQWHTSRDHILLSDREHIPHSAADVDEQDALLTVKDQPDSDTRPIARDRWQFARVEDGRVILDPNCVHLDGGFEPGLMYQLTYTTVGASVLGLGFLAMRDSVSFLRHASASEGNPAAGELDYAYAWGASQSGRFLRTFLNLDLNLDEEGREALDGVIPHVAGGMRGEFNQRFGQPSKDLPSVIAQLFPFADVESVDREIEESGALLARAGARGGGPKICITNTSAEYWRGDASLIHTDPAGESDLKHSAGVRIYHFAGTQHGSGDFPPERIRSLDLMKVRNPMNSVNFAPLSRAVLENLHRWVAEGIQPPPSSHPVLADGTAVAASSLNSVFDRIPGANFPSHVPVPRRLEFGFIESPQQTTQLPPKAGRAYGSTVSAVDADGNEVAGIPLPDVAVPLATYTGWNLRDASSGAPRMLAGLTGGLTGSTIPFPPTRAEQERTGDPRSSIEERYESRPAYLDQVRRAAERLVAHRYLLEDELDPMVERAGERWDWFTNPDARDRSASQGVGNSFP